MQSPPDIDALLVAGPDEARAWRRRLREPLSPPLRQGSPSPIFVPARTRVTHLSPGAAKKRGLTPELPVRRCRHDHLVIEIIPIRLPLREPFVIAYATYPDTSASW